MMRLWSLHPKYLDSKGLVAVWREGLLAKHVLEGKTRGYTHHPQLIRFTDSQNPIGAINKYLSGIYDESIKREYLFDKSKLSAAGINVKFKIPVNGKQLEYEFTLLKMKLMNRDIDKYNEIKDVSIIETHPMFVEVKGGIESWEKVIPEIVNLIYSE
jgi:hypothetical protein